MLRSYSVLTLQKGCNCMYETLSSLIARAFTGNRRPLEYYLREQSRLPGTRANLELVNGLSNLLTAIVSEHFFFNDTATTEIYTLSLHDALPISRSAHTAPAGRPCRRRWCRPWPR